jgi:hypothetical protein
MEIIEETKDLFDIFNDDKADQLEFLKTKKLALNAKVTKIYPERQFSAI